QSRKSGTVEDMVLLCRTSPLTDAGTWCRSARRTGPFCDLSRFSSYSRWRGLRIPRRIRAHRIGVMSILVVGEALIDIVSTPGSSNRYAPGGAPANIALGLGRLGDDVAFLTDIGDDFHGGFLLAHLRESRVEVLARPTGRTSTALARLAADGSADYDFRLRWAPDESLVEDGPRSILHFGSIAAFLQPGATVVDRLIDRIASPTDAWPEAALLTFDPNIRPSIIGSHDAVLPRFEQLASRVDLVK